MSKTIFDILSNLKFKDFMRSRKRTYYLNNGKTLSELLMYTNYWSTPEGMEILLLYLKMKLEKEKHHRKSYLKTNGFQFDRCKNDDIIHSLNQDIKDLTAILITEKYLELHREKLKQPVL